MSASTGREPSAGLFRYSAGNEFDVLVIGAGIAGLAAAHALAKTGRRVALLEARSRAGGRMHSVHSEFCDLPIELGAEFIHGRPAELLQLIPEAGKTYFELDGQSLCGREGRLEPCGFDEAFSVLRNLPEEPDRSLTEWIAQQRLPEAVARSASSYVEGFNAANAAIIGTKSLAVQQRAEDAIEGDRLFRVEEGYSAVAEYLAKQFAAAGGSLFLATPVRGIQWSRGWVETKVGAEEGSEARRFRARQSVITLPLGVLQAGDVHFAPAPERALSAANRLAMGAARRIVLVFGERFWAADYPEASFLFLEDALPSTWWTPAPKAAAILTGWVGGPRAQEPRIATGLDLLNESVAALAHGFSLTPERIRRSLRSWHTHDWRSDPFSRGAYSYVPAGALEALSIMAEPVENTLFFAGEHTDTTGSWGTVHGAMRSGLRAARQIGSGRQ